MSRRPPAAASACSKARDRVGGRLLSIADGSGAVDLGASWSWPGETQVQALVDELGVPTFEQHLAGEAVLEPELGSVQRVHGNPNDVHSGCFSVGAQALALRLAERLRPGTLRLSEPVTDVHVAHGRVHVRSRSGELATAHVVLPSWVRECGASAVRTRPIDPCRWGRTPGPANLRLSQVGTRSTVIAAASTARRSPIQQRDAA